ncbi:MAG: hypothetical protein JKY11_04600 [Alphaproteobacteria bacterium]|nr:hypothetical protein [Alphaproteobacteria bacterium]
MITDSEQITDVSNGLRSLYSSMPRELKAQRRDTEIRELCARWKNHRDVRAQEIIVTSFIPLCIKISNRTAKDYHLNVDDRYELEEVAVSSLIETINRFNPEYNNLFYSYAIRRMNGAALDYIKKKFGLQAVWQKELFFNLSKIKRGIKEETPDIPKGEFDQKIIEHVHKLRKINITSYEIGETEKTISLVASGQWAKAVDLDTLSYSDSQSDFLETNPENLLMNEEKEVFENAFVTKAAKHLGAESWYIVEKMVLSDEPPSKRKMAKKLGISEGRVTEILGEAIVELQALFSDFKGEFKVSATDIEVVFEPERSKPKITYHSYETNILICAIMHNENAEVWPSTGSGKVQWGPLKGRDWRLIHRDIENGILDESDATSLREFLAPYKEIVELTVDNVLDMAEIFTEKSLNIEDILAAAKLYHIEYARWPSCNDYKRIVSGPLDGETWGAVDKQLRDGGRDLPGGQSLARLLEDNGLGDHITTDDIIVAAQQHHNKTGGWPSSSETKEIKTGPLKGKTWKGMSTAFYRGYYNLPTDTTLSQFLKDNGCCDDNTLAPSNIIAAAKIHKENTGKWPSSKDNKVIVGGPLDGEKWCVVHTALRDGYRGLTANGKGLPQFLKDNGCVDRKPTMEDVVISALRYKNTHSEGKWPNNKVPEKIDDGTILSGMSWSSVDKRKIGELSLFNIIKKHEASAIDIKRPPVMEIKKNLVSVKLPKLEELSFLSFHVKNFVNVVPNVTVGPVFESAVVKRQYDLLCLNDEIDTALEEDLYPKVVLK